MIIAPKELLRDAQERHYAIPAFNFYNLDGLFAVLEAPLASMHICIWITPLTNRF